MFFCKVFIFEHESHTEVGRQANKEKQLPKWSRVFVLLINVENFGEYVFKLPCHLIPKAGLFLCVRSDTYGPVWSRGAVGAPAVPTWCDPVPKHAYHPCQRPPLWLLFGRLALTGSAVIRTLVAITPHTPWKERMMHAYQGHPAAVFALALSSVTCFCVNNQSGA